MKLKTKIRAGKIRPNHNVTVHGTAASSFATGRIAAQAAETAEVVTLTASTSGAVVAILRAAAQARMPLREAQGLGRTLSQQTGGQNSMRLLRGKEHPMKLQTRIKAGRPNPNHNTIVR